ncbi:ankyrin repeat protein [Pelomyxa schiedti]|nr:ankyrin repeat protein [Pelomyxa schiedti]
MCTQGEISLQCGANNDNSTEDPDDTFVEQVVCAIHEGAASEAVSDALRRRPGIANRCLRTDSSAGCVVTPLLAAVQVGDCAVVRAVLENGGEPNKATPAGNTALFFACANGSLEVARELLAHGASTSSKNVAGDTPLHFAAVKGIPEVIAELISAGANPNEKNLNGLTPLMCAVENSNTLAVDALLHAGSDSSLKDKNGNTALHHSAKCNNIECIRPLLQAPHNKSLTQRNKYGKTCLAVLSENKSNLLPEVKKVWLELEKRAAECAAQLLTEERLEQRPKRKNKVVKEMTTKTTKSGKKETTPPSRTTASKYHNVPQLDRTNGRKSLREDNQRHKIDQEEEPTVHDSAPDSDGDLIQESAQEVPTVNKATYTTSSTSKTHQKKSSHKPRPQAPTPAKNKATKRCPAAQAEPQSTIPPSTSTQVVTTSPATPCDFSEPTPDEVVESQDRTMLLHDKYPQTSALALEVQDLEDVLLLQSSVIDSLSVAQLNEIEHIFTEGLSFVKQAQAIQLIEVEKEMMAEKAALTAQVSALRNTRS